MPLNPMRRLVAVVATGTVLGSSVAAAADDPDEAAAGAGPPLHSPQALQTMAEPRWRFSAGTALGLPGLYGFRAVGVGGWFAVGAGRLRLEIDYSHRQGREEESGTFGRGEFTSEYTWVDGWDVDAVRVVVTRHFREERRVRTHLLFGVGYYDSGSYSCNASRELFRGDVLFERPEECVRNAEGDFAGVLGGGIEIAVGARFFVRAQSRGFVSANDSDPGLVSLLQATLSEVLVGVGVRF